MKPERMLLDALTAQMVLRRDERAMHDGTTTLSWSELHWRAVDLAARLPEGPLGLYGENDCAWAVTFLAALLAGRTVVPLPDFFSDAQCEHVVRAAGISTVLATSGGERLAHRQGVAVVDPQSLRCSRSHDRSQTKAACDGSCAYGNAKIERATDALVVFTSGSTGRPKGVRLTLANLMATADALIEAVGISSDDSYLSVMPLSMLLEQVCALLVPVLTGAPVSFNREVARRIMQGEAIDLASTVAQIKPSVMVLVPQLLSALVAQMKTARMSATELGLRFIAVGGASVGAAALNEARALGLPVFEGYGLTECASVVALNTPDHVQTGTVGRPLGNRRVEIIDGEIVVSGPSVMAGYLGAPDLDGNRWPTGDVGVFTDDGALVVHGRKDNLIVSSNGRNVSPEWVEAAILETPGVQSAVVCPAPDNDGLIALVVADWPADRACCERASLERRLAAVLPNYACPKSVVALSPATAAGLGLIRMGKPDRRLVRAMLNENQPANQGTYHESV